MSLSVIKTKITKLEVLEIYFYSLEKADKKIYPLFQLSPSLNLFQVDPPETYKIINADYKMGRF